MKIETPEDHLLQNWLDAEKGFNDPGQPESPTPEPHPNEIATREAVTAGVYAAEDVGVVPTPKTARKRRT